MDFENPTLFIDVRTPAEYADGHIAGTINIPHEQVTDIAEAIGDDKNRHVVLYCRSGGRVGMTIPYLMQLGYTNIENGGGLTDIALELGVDIVRGG